MRACLTLASLATYYAISQAAVLPIKNSNGAWVGELEPGKWEVSDDTGMKTLYNVERDDHKFCDKKTLGAKAVVTTTGDNKYASCCVEGQGFYASADALTFMCCPAGHEMMASPDKSKHTCCPTGMVYDGTACTPAPPKCTGGKELVEGKCLCPKGQMDKGGECVDKPKCDSGLQTGKCYIFTAESGKRYGFSKEPGFNYCPDIDSAHHRYGKFQLCPDADCTAGQPVNPDTNIFIRDLSGEAYTGARAGMWLDNALNGAHIGKTAEFAKAGKFTLSKWPCGKYCWSGYEDGLGPTCPSVCVGVSFWPEDRQSCIPITILEVPCDITDTANNCLWDSSGNQCCSPDKCESGPQKNYEEGEKFGLLTGTDGKIKVQNVA